MSPDRNDREIEALLRRALHEQAELIQPAGDGLAKIQQRAVERRRRRLWLRPSIAVLAAAIAVVAAVAVPTLVHRADHGSDTAASRPPAATHSASRSESAQTPAAPAWPYRDAKSAQRAGTKAAQLTPTTLAQTFVQTFLSTGGVGATPAKLTTTVQQQTDRTLTVAVQRADLGRAVCQVQLTRVSAEPPIYVVTGATSGKLTVRTTAKVEQALAVPISGTFEQSPNPQVSRVWSALVLPNGSTHKLPDRQPTGSVSAEPGIQPWTVQLTPRVPATQPGIVAAWTVDSDGQVLDFAATAAQ